ncbi:MAG: hypothetical protein CMO80_25190 [Verrucomicrobiales bacterium]|nr:hypothetical protein [Verrucomicrobiales bacterium]
MHVQNAGTALYGAKRKYLEFGAKETDPLNAELNLAVQHFIGNGRRQEENAASDIAHVVCMIFSGNNSLNEFSDDEVREVLRNHLPVDFIRDKNGLVATPTKVEYPLTFPERVDCSTIISEVEAVNTLYTTHGISAAASALAEIMANQYTYLIEGTADIDTQLLRIHAIQNAVCVVHLSKFEDMVNASMVARDTKVWLPGYSTIDSYLIQEAPYTLQTQEGRVCSGMSHEFSEECMWTSSHVDPKSVTTTFAMPTDTTRVTDITEAVFDRVKAHIETAQLDVEKLNKIKFTRGVATLHSGCDEVGSYTIAIYNWHASRKGDNYSTVFSLAANLMLDVLHAEAKNIAPCDDILCIVAGDTNLKNAAESAAAASCLQSYGLEMFNSASETGEDKCCKVTVDRGARTKIMQTQWSKTEPVVAMKDALVTRKQTESDPFCISATVFDDHPILDHKGWGFTVYRKSANPEAKTPIAVQMSAEKRFLMTFVFFVKLYIGLWIAVCALDMLTA